MKKLLIITTIAIVTAIWFVWQQSTPTIAEADTSLLPLLVDDGSGAAFAQATEPNAISFPEDLGAHNEYQTEWWYYTGNLETETGRPFGFQFTIFRRALAADAVPEAAPNSASDWRSNQVYLAHFALSDIANEQFYAHERFSRAGAELAGATAVPYRVWLENWFVEEVAPGQVRLFAADEEVTLDLILNETLPPVLHGNGGLSQKGEQVGNASYYYSIVRQEAGGTVTVKNETVDVTGLAWKDHEYSTSALTAGDVGWDWFSLQFDNGTSLMFFQIRREDGTLSPLSSGSFIDADGTLQSFTADDWALTVTDTWTSPTSGSTYPAGWQISVPTFGIELEGRPFMPNQELNVSTVYWEGAVQFSGTMNGKAVSAKGYIEMTGYAGGMNGRL
ncbi:MAG: lipocalin-like domain-containing protein [Chloroflexota bacterium]